MQGRIGSKDGRNLQMAHVGRRPARSTRLYKKKEGVISGPEEVKTTWYQHFTKVLNILSEYCKDVLDGMPSLPPAMELVKKCREHDSCSSCLWTSRRPTTLCAGKCCGVFWRSMACPQQCCL